MSLARVGRLSGRRRLSTHGACKTGALHWLLVLGLWSFVSSPLLHAHDPFESWTAITVRADQLEVGLVMSQGTALRLVDPTAKIRGLTDENFATHQPVFVKQAESLFVVTAGRTTLKPKKIEAELTEEGDVSWKFVFARPPPGPLHLHAAFMKKLGEGFGGMVEANTAAGEQLGWDQITWENPNFEFTVPAASAASAPKKK
jgi:hypothetical protein